MARRFTSGFETNNLLSTEWSSSGGTPSIGSTNPHSGTYRLNSNSANGASNVTRAFQAQSSGSLYYRWYWLTNDATPAATINLMLANDNVSVTTPGVNLTAASAITMTNSTGVGTDTTADDFITADTWYRFELRHLVDGSAGELELRIYLGDSLTALDTLLITGEDTLPGAGVAAIRLGKGSGSSSGLVYSYDDVGINNSTDAGDGQNTWLGPAKTFLMVPIQDSPEEIAWTPSTGTDNYALVDDLPGNPDDDTTYVSTSTINLEDWYRVTDPPAELPGNADIKLVHDMMRAKGNATTPDVRVMFWDGASTTNGPTATLSGSYAFLGSTTHLIVVPSGHIKVDAEGYHLGIQLLSAEDCRVTAVWANVEWLEGADVTLMGAMLC